MVSRVRLPLRWMFVDNFVQDVEYLSFLSGKQHRSKFRNPSKVETGWIFLRSFIFPLLILCLNPLMVLSHTDVDSGMKKNEAMMGTFTGTGLIWFLTCMFYCSKNLHWSLWAVSSLWRFMSRFTVRHRESTIIHSDRSVSVTSATWINVLCDTHLHLFSHEHSPVLWTT